MKKIFFIQNWPWFTFGVAEYALQGMGNGTVIFAFVNGSLIHLFSKRFEHFWNFEDKFVLWGKLTGK